MSALAGVPGTVEWLLVSIDLRAQAAVRRELRRLLREVDAMFAGVWIRGPQELIAFAGECAAAPVQYPDVASTVVSTAAVRDTSGQEYDAVVVPPQLGRSMPRLGLIAVGVTAGPDVFEAVEACAERVEAIIVDAIAPHAGVQDD